MKQLGGADAGFLYMETPQTPMHVASLNIVELPKGFKGDFYETYKTHIAGRLHLVPVLQRKIVPVPWDIDHPLWVDDDEVDLDYHIRHLGLPKPGTMKQLEELVGRLHSNFLDRSRPLWEFYVIDGLAGNRLAVYTKIHHAAVDGGANMALNQMMYDPTPVPRQIDAPPQPARRGEHPGVLEVLGTAYKHLVDEQVSAVKSIPQVLKAIASLAQPVVGGARQLQLKRPAALVAPKTMLNVSVTSQRAFTACSLPMAQAKAIAKQTDTKLNDVVMAVCAGALRRYLLERDELPAEPMVAMVPVSLREPGNTESNNQVSAMLCSLATHLDDPLERLLAIHASSVEAKGLSGKIRAATPREFPVFGAPLLLQGAIGLYARSGLADRLAPTANVVISNVPGPQAPLYLAGAKILTLYPVSIPSHGMALNMTVQSYQGSLDFGLTACRRAVPELGKLAIYLEQSLRELHDRVCGEAPSTRTLSPPRQRARPAATAAALPKKRASPTRKAASTAPRKTGPTTKEAKPARR
jgi:diacylglycerol O-acyltransferase / wax synthase